MACLLARENEHELCSFCRFSGIIIRGTNRSEKDRHLCRWDERIRRTFFQEERTHKPSHSSPQFPRSSLGTPGILHRCFPFFRNINLRTPGSCRLFTCCGDEVARLQQVRNLNSRDNFQIYSADMYLVRFLVNFAGFRVYWWISRDFVDLVEFAAPRPREISEALNCC